jgi:hypothetical protein
VSRSRIPGAGCYMWGFADRQWQMANGKWHSPDTAY